MCDNRKPTICVKVTSNNMVFKNNFPLVEDPKAFKQEGYEELCYSITDWLYDTTISCAHNWDVEITTVCGECNNDIGISYGFQFFAKGVLVHFKNDSFKVINECSLAISDKMLFALRELEHLRFMDYLHRTFLELTFAKLLPEPGTFSHNCPHLN